MGLKFSNLEGGYTICDFVQKLMTIKLTLLILALQHVDNVQCFEEQFPSNVCEMDLKNVQSKHRERNRRSYN